MSTEDQATEGFSLETQTERLDAFCLAQGWTSIGPPYSDDSTGTDTDRPGYKKMLGDSVKWDVAVSIKGDRFHRSVDNARAFWREMRVAGKQIWTIAEGRLDTAENASKWLGTMITTALLPEFESMQISERVLPGMEKAKQKNLHVGRPPTGFVWVKELGRFVPTDWGEKVRRDAADFGIDEAARMNKWQAGKREGKPLSRSAAWRIVKNFELYAVGELLPNRRKTSAGTWSKFKNH